MTEDYLVKCLICGKVFSGSEGHSHPEGYPQIADMTREELIAELQKALEKIDDLNNQLENMVEDDGR